VTSGHADGDWIRARRWVAWDELLATITAVWLAEARSCRHTPMPGVMAQVLIKQQLGAWFPGSPSRVGWPAAVSGVWPGRQCER